MTRGEAYRNKFSNSESGEEEKGHAKKGGKGSSDNQHGKFPLKSDKRKAMDKKYGGGPKRSKLNDRK